jgi:hypothetical protein
LLAADARLVARWGDGNDGEAFRFACTPGTLTACDVSW